MFHGGIEDFIDMWQNVFAKILGGDGGPPPPSYNFFQNPYPPPKPMPSHGAPPLKNQAPPIWKTTPPIETWNTLPWNDS